MKHNVESVTLLLNFKEMTNITMNKSKDRIETFTKSVKSQLEMSEAGMKVYMKGILDVSEKNSKLEFDNFDGKIANVRMENNRYAVDLKNSAIELKSEKEEVIRIKNELHSIVESSSKLNLDKIEHFYDKFLGLSAEYDVIKVKFNEIAEFIKVIIYL